MSEKDIRERIKNRRKELGLSLEEVAQKVGVTKATVYRWETGAISNMGIDKANLLADILKLDPLELLGRTIPNDPVSTLSKKEKFKYDEFMEDAVYYFNDESVSDEDKKKLLDSLNNIFFDIILEKKKKGK